MIWGLAYVDTSDEEEAGCTSSWRGLSVGNIAGGAAITCMAVFEESGLLVAGNSEGEINIWKAQSDQKSNWNLIASRKVESNSAVTSVSAVEGVLFAGLESGVLMFSEIQAEESRLVPVKGLQQSVMKGSSKAVASLYVSQYWEPRKGQAIPALFAGASKMPIVPLAPRWCSATTTPATGKAIR